MSASRDQSQKIAFVYSNLYKVYQQGKAAAKDAVVPQPETAPVVAPKSSNVIKTEDLHKPELKVSAFQPTEFIGKRVERPAVIAKAVAPAPKEALNSLKDNLKALNDLHSRLRFMLQELEDLVKE